MSELTHVPVLLEESVEALALRPGAVVVDGTFGGGGHTRAILERVPGSCVIAVDRDEAAVARAEALSRELDGRVVPVHGSFADLERLLAGLDQRGCLRPLTSTGTAGAGAHGGAAGQEGGDGGGAPLVTEGVDGVLLDLGLSSFQLDDPARGFAFRLEGPLDMRFDPTQGVSAAELVNELDERELADVIFRNGDERRSRRIAAAIVRARRRGAIATTVQLAEIVEAAVGGRKGSPTHPATQTFQALRIAVNDELGALRRGLEGAVAVLRPGGRLAVISFHSIEDRIVKQTMRSMAATCVCPPEQPVCTCDTVPSVRVVGKPIRPGEVEERGNPRSRSATLRVAERL